MRCAATGGKAPFCLLDHPAGLHRQGQPLDLSSKSLDLVATWAPKPKRGASTHRSEDAQQRYLSGVEAVRRGVVRGQIADRFPGFADQR
jgi:hypothetical protein